MKMMKNMIAALFFMSIVPLCAMENKKDNVISDADLLVRKKAFTLQFKNKGLTERAKKEILHYPKDSNIKVDLTELNKELELSNFYEVFNFGHMFVIPAGMDEKFIHKTLVPKRVPDFELEAFGSSEEEFLS